MAMMIKISEFIRLREAAGLTQTELARKAHCAQQLISLIEGGDVKTTKKIYKIAAALGVSASQLDPDIPAHPLERYFSAIDGLEPADSEWVLAQLGRVLDIVRERSVGQIGDERQIRQKDGDGGHKREKHH